MMNKLPLKIISAIAASASAIFLVGETGNAITITNTSITPVNGSNAFTYSITLDNDDSLLNAGDDFLGVADTLNFTNLVGVTGVTFGLDSPYQLVGFDSTTVNLEIAPDTINGPVTIDNAVTIVAEAFPGDVDAAIEFSDNSVPNLLFTNVTGPATPIPFETEAGLGAVVLGIFVAGRTYWKRRQKG